MNAIGRLAREALSAKRKDGKRGFLLHRCRELMAAGNFRPTSAEICTRAPHDIINLFGNLPTLYEQALDNGTVKRIADKIGGSALTEVPDLHRIARAAVFGRLST